MQKKRKSKIILAAVCAAVLAGCGKTDSQILWEEPVSLQSETQVQESEPVSESTKETQPQLLVVDISGAVAYPGVYYLREGSRICDAVEMAGGLLKDADRDSLNQAALLQDGSKIVIYTMQEAETAGSSEAVSGMSETQSAKVNINTADVAQLCTLSGVGESRAKDIIAYREQNGLFETIEDIMNVSGIKEATFNKIKEEISVG